MITNFSHPDLIYCLLLVRKLLCLVQANVRGSFNHALTFLHRLSAAGHVGYKCHAAAGHLIAFLYT